MVLKELFILLHMIMVLWLCKKMSFILEIHKKHLENLPPLHDINLGKLGIEGSILPLIKSCRGLQDQMPSLMNESGCIPLYDTTLV